MTTRFLPETLISSFEQHITTNPITCKYKQDVAVEILYQIQKGICFGNQGGWIELSYKVFENINYDNYNAYLFAMEQSGVIEVNHKYSNFDGNKICKNYRLEKNCIDREIKYYKISDKCLLKRLRAGKNKTVKNRRWEMMCNSISIDVFASKEWVSKQDYTPIVRANLLSQIDRINDKDYYLVQDSFSSREHTNLTNLPSYIRNNYIKIDGMSILEVDIPAAQPSFLFKALQNMNKRLMESQRGFPKDLMKGKESSTNSSTNTPTKPPTNSNLVYAPGFSFALEFELSIFHSLLLTKTFYEHFIQGWKDSFDMDITRSEAKLLVFKVFFDRTRAKPKTDKVSNYHYQSLFARLFPLVYKQITSIHSEITPRGLARLLQQEEVDYVMNKSDNLECNHFTVHDAIYYPSSEDHSSLFDDVLSVTEAERVISYQPTRNTAAIVSEQS